MNKFNIDPRNIFLKGKFVSLTALTLGDIESTNWYGWFNDEHLCEYTQKHYFPNTFNKQVKYLSEIEDRTDIIVLGILYENNLVGVCSLNDINFINRNCSISIFIGERMKEENVALETIFLLLKHSFYTLNLNKVKMGQHVKLRLIFSKLSLVFGFFNEGVSRLEVFKKGKYYDVINSSVLKSEFEQRISDPSNMYIARIIS